MDKTLSFPSMQVKFDLFEQIFQNIVFPQSKAGEKVPIHISLQI